MWIEGVLVEDCWVACPLLLIVGLDQGEPDAEDLLNQVALIRLRDPSSNVHVHICQEI